jgi:hypothetical protein
MTAIVTEVSPVPRTKSPAESSQMLVPGLA